ncbi:synapse-associated protein of 47 kDa-like [Diabrotica virgifera virgifera]|uniref:BSD domain-containing protein n=1 Tax=Diabrotica virgifera virgifera TaxID=50390 RepID=A0ABM5JW54_DIAVI|nr:synapse-associated protein of 47 kDa-like [Diabrotica virgifera virgifera]
MFGEIISKVSSWVESFNNEEETTITIPAEDKSVESHLFQNNEFPGVSKSEQTENTESTPSASKESSTSEQNSRSESDSCIKPSEHYSVDTLVSPEVFSNAISSVVMVVKDTVSKLKESVLNKNMLSEFNKEQDRFIQNQQDDLALPLPPWVGCPNEHVLKENCLSLSSDLRHFLCSPPSSVDFQFNYKACYPTALAVMNEDPDLEKIRYKLVPKAISEENFWRNYFYRVNLLCQANEEFDKLDEEKTLCNPVVDTNQISTSLLEDNGVSETDFGVGLD